MKLKKHLNHIILCLIPAILGSICSLNAQIDNGIYISEVDNVQHELKIDNNYFIHSVYSEAPAKFIKTVGGFYTDQNNTLNVKLEFNSDYETDGQREIKIPYSFEDGDVSLEIPEKVTFGTAAPSYRQDLDGQWLFATRGPDEGQERRGDENPRKTLKFLLNGRFQWIAYQIETMKFSGTGGGSFSSQNGEYVENIEYFSKDNSRVGASLKFNYELKDDDWHHTGNNSKGEPMYEIWSRR